MKIKQHIFYFFTMFLLVNVFRLRAADSTNQTASTQESWVTISNRWSSVPLDQIRQTAEGGDVVAQYYLGRAHLEGIGVATDQNEGYKWIKRAADLKYARAQYYLGWMYENGTNVSQDYNEAATFYRLAADQGYAIAQNNLGFLYYRGLGVPQDFAEAVKWYQKSAEQGEVLGEENLGCMYENGDGVPENFLESIKWYQKAAEQGGVFAEKKLAWIYARGSYGEGKVNGQGAEAQIRSGGVAPNHELAEKWMRQAVDLNSPEGQCQFGDLLSGEFDNAGHQDATHFPDAGEWYRKAAEQGFAEAQEKLAEMYNYGQLGNDQRSNCIPWFLKAAAQGNAEAQAEIGELRQLYPNSELLKSINPIDSLKQAAMQGNLQAQFELARRYHAGDGAPKDSVESFKWMEMAAQHDISPVTWTIDAHYYLGVMYEKGDGVTKNLTNAYKLYLEAAVGGNKPEPFVRVGQMYENGEGVPQDDRQATEYYYSALQFGFAPTSHGDVARCTAIENLLNLYFQGRGLPDDKTAVSQQLDEIKRNHCLVETI